MTLFELSILPMALGIVLLLGQATFFRQTKLALAIILLSSAMSFFCLSHNLFGQLVALSTLVIALLSMLNPPEPVEEYGVLLLSSSLGALVLCQASDWIYLFVGIELLTLPVYGLIAFEHRNAQNLKAAVKYFVLAGLSSAVMLLGMGVLYAQSGLLDLSLNNPLGGALFLMGVAFKLSVAPFYLWTPDVYEDSPLLVTAFLATVSKISFASILASLSLSLNLLPILMLMAILSMLVGAFLTLKTDQITRFLAYSSVAHMGYVLVAWITDGSVLFYMTSYVISVLLIFAMILWLDGEDLVGLWGKKPLPALFLIFGFFSLMGLPITPIFWAKYRVLTAALVGDYTILFGTMILSSLIAVYGYARFITRICQRN